MTPRYVELVRVSTAGQAERDTPEIQRLALDRLRASRPGRLVERIEALGVSGALGLEERPDLRRLRDLSGRYDELRVYALDRLTRSDDPRERLAVYGLVADGEAVIVDVGGRVVDPQSEIGELDYYLQSWAAARERKKIAQRTNDGRKKAAASGRNPGSSPPYGRAFDKLAGRWGLDKERARLYRRMFERYLDGGSIPRLTAWLNAQTVPPPRAGCGRWTGRWAGSSVRRMLRDPAAHGEWTRYGVAVRVPPVVDRATWDAVQARLAAGRSRAGRPGTRHEAMLRKLLVCDACGATMHVEPSKGRVYYRCGARCGSPMYEVGRVDEAARELARLWARQPRSAKRRAAATIERERPEDVQAELADLVEQERRLATALRRGLLSDAAVAEQSREIAAQRSAALSRLAALERQPPPTDDAAARLMAWRRRITAARPGDWRELAPMLFPRGPGIGLRLTADGALTGLASIPISGTTSSCSALFLRVGGKRTA